MTQCSRERPILFSAPMVRAILAGAKTQTRRVIVPGLKHPNWTGFSYYERSGIAIENGPDYPDDDSDVRRPRYQPGDTLWVRETCQSTLDGRWNYRATSKSDEGPWGPSIFMPRAACRLLLRVTAVRVERVQEISDGDARAEGASFHDGRGVGHSGWRHDDSGPVYGSAIESFRALWDSLNAKRGYGWSEKPWVWVYEFERV